MEEIEKEILLLTSHERATLAKRLLLSLEGQESSENEAEIEHAWIEEAKRRAKEYEKNPSIGRDADQVLKEMRSKFK